MHDFLHDGIGITEGSWGLSIILFTAFLRTLIFPLNYISYEATDRNKALKPYMDKIRERYAEDQQSMNLATAKLYEMTETNPLAGCLPAIAQIPVFIALYRSILNLAFEKRIGPDPASLVRASRTIALPSAATPYSHRRGFPLAPQLGGPDLRQRPRPPVAYRQLGRRRAAARLA